MKRHRDIWPTARGVLIGAFAAAAISGGVAWAAIPDTAGVIHTCYSQSTGTWRPIDYPAQKCKSGETLLDVNQKGPKGESVRQVRRDRPGRRATSVRPAQQALPARRATRAITVRKVRRATPETSRSPVSPVRTESR